MRIKAINYCFRNYNDDNTYDYNDDKADDNNSTTHK